MFGQSQGSWIAHMAQAYAARGASSIGVRAAFSRGRAFGAAGSPYPGPTRSTATEWLVHGACEQSARIQRRARPSIVGEYERVRSCALSRHLHVPDHPEHGVRLRRAALAERGDRSVPGRQQRAQCVLRLRHRQRRGMASGDRRRHGFRFRRITDSSSPAAPPSTPVGAMALRQSTAATPRSACRPI